MFAYPVVFVDIETTGGSYRTSRVLEIAAIRYENGEVVDEFTTLINPGTYIPASITALTGIAEADIVDAPAFEDIADRLLEIMDGAVFVAHNVRFDYSFLKHEFSLVGSKFVPKLLCTVRLSRALYAGIRGHSLQKLIERHNIPFTSRHRALDDARAIMYFAKIAYDEHGQTLFDAAIARQLKTQALPAHIDEHVIDQMPNTPGVYVFEDETGRPVYIGKSVTLRKRVLSHFQETKPGKELKIAAATHHIRWIETVDELTALLLESQMVKEHLPLYNRQLRRISSYTVVEGDYNENGYLSLTTKSVRPSEMQDLKSIYGIFASRMKAKNRLEELLRTFQLCPKLLGLEKTKTSCFLYQLGRCKGACVGDEPAELYNRRVELAMERLKISEWPYKSAIALMLDDGSRSIVIDQWIIQGYITHEMDGVNSFEPAELYFDVDTYKILRTFLQRKSSQIKLLPQGYL